MLFPAEMVPLTSDVPEAIRKSPSANPEAVLATSAIELTLISELKLAASIFPEPIDNVPSVEMVASPLTALFFAVVPSNIRICALAALAIVTSERPVRLAAPPLPPSLVAEIVKVSLLSSWVTVTLLPPATNAATTSLTCSSVF